MATKTAKSYAYAVTSQDNPNVSPQKLKWINEANAIGHNTKTYAESSFTYKSKATHYTNKITKDSNGKQITTKVADKWESIQNRPWTLACYDFQDLKIPSNAYIYKIKFNIRLKKSSKVTVPKPMGSFRFHGGSFPDWDYRDGVFKDGWNNGFYVDIPTGNLKNSWDTYTYVINESDIKNAKVTISDLNSSVFGIDLLWKEANFNFNNTTNKVNVNKTYEADVYVEWVQCIVEYDVPEYTIQIINPIDIATPIGINKNALASFKANSYDGTESNPYQVGQYNDFPMLIRVSNPSKAKGKDTRVFNVDIPWGTTIVDSVYDGTFAYDSDSGKWKWTVPVCSKCSYDLNLMLRPAKNGLSKISVTGWYQSSAAYYYFVNQSQLEGGINQIQISSNTEIRKFTKSCVNIQIHGQSNNDTITINTNFDNNVRYPSTGNAFSLNTILSSNNVSIDSQTSSSITLNVPSGTEEYDVSLDYCFYPTTTSDLQLTVTNTDSSTSQSQTFNVLDSYTYILGSKNGKLNDSEYGIGFYGDNILFMNHRVASDLETGATIIPCVADETDSNMVMSGCKINMSLFEQLDYIGCIPLDQTHFSPKSTFKDTLINQSYKNKRYMGKKLAPDEDITLNIRLHPKQVTTLQGLIKMDKPIPINTNHKTFEGDSLNHRGWVEVYGVKAEKTNPHWYKCDVDVKYLTHNLNTRFYIEKGKKVSDYNIPSLMTESYASGDNLSLDDIYFKVDTDGSFYYAEDYDDITFNDNERNNFNIGNGQHIKVTSDKPLSHTSNVNFAWSSVLIDEIRENYISRVIRLIDKSTKLTVFEYEYDDISVDDDEVSSHVIYRVLDNKQELVDWHSPRDITFRYNPSDVTLEDSNEDLTVDADDNVDIVDNNGEAHFGTTTRLFLENNKLKIVDEGFNGKEITINDINLIEGEYYYQVEWINKNGDGETIDVDCVFDFQVQDTILTSTYADKFGKLMISPFPIPKKEIIFIREAEEGTLYYYKNDDEEFSYRIDPYYQYQNGTDLVYQGESIFDLNYGYEIVYIQNGLVRLGFNCLDGQLYLGKYDFHAEEYITTHILHLDKYNDINVNSISDDKIEIQASDCLFTIWRGHPYIKVKHELEDIFIDTVSTRVWAEQVGDDDSVELPAYWDLMNTQNLLPACVGGNMGLKSSCVITEQIPDNENQTTDLSWSNFPTTGLLTGTDITFNVSSSSSVWETDEGIVWVLDGEEIETTNTSSYTLNFDDEGEHDIQAVFVGNDELAMSSTPKTHFKISQPPINETGSPENNGSYKLSFVEKTTTVTYKDNTIINLRLTKGGVPISGRAVQRQDYDGTVDTASTNSKGFVQIRNSIVDAGKYKIGGFYQDENGKRVSSSYRTITVKKGTPTLTDNFTTVKSKSQSEAYVVGSKYKATLKFRGNALTNTKLSLYVNGKLTTLTTSKTGAVYYQFKSKGTYNLKLVYKGNKNLNSVELSRTITIKE